MKKILSLVLIMIVAVCAGIFVGCGGATGDNISLEITSGLDSTIGSSALNGLTSELKLTENEKTALSTGTGYNATVADKTAVTLVLGSESYSTREVIVKIVGWEEGMGKNVYFSTDSSAISISDTEYLSGGRAKITITALSAGTAKITARSGQYSKTVDFTVKVVQKLNTFAVKNNSVIYLERGKLLTINPNSYLNFYPSTATMREVEFYRGEECLTINGITKLSTDNDTNATGVITENTDLTIKSTRLDNTNAIEPISVVIVDSIQQLEMKKLEYVENATDLINREYTTIETPLWVIRNGEKTYTSGAVVDYSLREVYVVVQNSESKLNVVAGAYINGEKLPSILVLPADEKQVTAENYDSISEEYQDLIDLYKGGLEEYSFWVFKFTFQYEGYSAYDVKFNFNVDNYIYEEELGLSLEFKNASDLVEFKKSNEENEAENNEYTIYDWYEGVYGTRFSIKTNTGDLPYQLRLILSEDANESLDILSSAGQNKARSNIQNSDLKYISFLTGENFYIKGKTGAERANAYEITAQVSYVHDGITFITEKTIKFFVESSPNELKFHALNPTTLQYYNISSYNFDLNTSGVRISTNGTTSYTARNTLALYLFGFIDQVSTGAATDFTIVNNSAKILRVEKGEDNEIILTALGVGTGNFKIILGNNVNKTFEFETIHSVSDFSITLPNEQQNDNVFNLRSNFAYGRTTYRYNLVALNNKNIPLSVTKSGIVKSINVVESEGNGVTYANGVFRATKTFENKVVSVNITYNCIDSNGAIVEGTAVGVEKFLMSSMVELSLFNLTTSKNSTNFNLYDYSSVGYYSQQFSKVNVYLSVLPEELSDILLSQVVWASNRTTIEESITENSYYLETDVFTFTYYKTGANKGTGVLVCNVENPELYDASGNFKEGKVVLSATIDRGDYGKYSKNFQFGIIKNTKIELIDTSVDEIYLDAYSNKVDLNVTTYPLDASNNRLVYQFIPSGNLLVSDLKITETSFGASIELQNNNIAGSGILRIIALDSYINAENYQRYIDIPVEISDGSAAHPYYILSKRDINKMISTNFNKNYVVSGNISLAESNWEFGKYVLTGSIIGENSAAITGFVIKDYYKDSTAREYYFGLFKEIVGTIENIAIETSFNIDLTANTDFTNTYNGFIGSLAARNSGTIKNVYAKIDGGTVTMKDGYTIDLGGLVGVNSGLIITDITASSKYNSVVEFTEELEIKDSTISNAFYTSNGTHYYTMDHSLFVGGVVGSNLGGRIQRNIAFGLVEFNNAYATANINISAVYENEQNNLSSASEGLGGIAGRSIGASTSIANDQQGLYGVSSCGIINSGIMGPTFTGCFNNVGGLVGFNGLNIDLTNATGLETTRSTTQTYVRGRENVGGAVGYNNGGTVSALVENLENKKIGYAATLIIGQNNVGGIIGNHNAGTLQSSSFISYLNRTLSNTSEPISDATKYYGDLISYGSYSAIVGSKTGTVEYVIAIAEVKGTDLATLTDNNNNYGVYNTTNDNPILYNGAIAGTTTKQGLNNVYGFEFVFIPPTSIGLVMTEDGQGQQMTTGSSSDDLAVYLYYYSSTELDVNKLNGLNSTLITDLLESSIGKKYTLESSDTNILEIGSNGQFIAKGTGLVKIKATTPYNIALEQYIYIYVISYTNNISLYLDSNRTNEIREGSNLIFDATDSTMLYVNFLDKFNINKMALPTDINVLFEVEIGGTVYQIVPGQNKIDDDDIVFTLTQVSPSVYQIAVYGNVATYESVVIKPYIEFSDNGKTYRFGSFGFSDIVGERTDLGLKDEIITNIEFENTTKSVNCSKDTIITEPYYDTNVDISLDSIKEDESLEISIIAIDPITHEALAANDVTMLKVTVIYNGTATENSLDGVRLGAFTINGINCKTNANLKVYFSIEQKEIAETIAFRIEFTSSNGKTAQLILTFEPQEVINVTTTIYPLISSNDDIYGFTGEFSYIPSGVIIPGQNSLIDFDIFPYFTNYSTVEIINASGNQYNLLFDLFNRTQEESVLGATYLTNGISIPKSIITNGHFSLRTFLDQNATDNSSVSVIVILRDENGEELERTTKSFYVEQLPGVRVTVDGVSSGNDEADPLKLARGIEYDMSVWVKGYTAGTLVRNGSVYNDGEIVFVVSNPSLVSIVKDTDGSYKLVVTANALSGNRKVEIKTYGQRLTEKGVEKSKEVSLYIEIVQFVVKANNGSDIVKGVSNGVYASAIGNVYDFTISLNSNILIYDQTSEEITSMVLDFLTSLSTGNSVWAYQDQSKGLISWASVSESNRSFVETDIANVKEFNTENGIFKLLYNTSTKEFSVRFLKNEYSNSPSFKFKYNAFYHYDSNGTPTFGNSEGNYYELKQEFVFDIFEKTNIRNPYPIYTYEQFMNMREGNYYILMNDITLQEDFAPITTLIGGLDGNNHRLIIPNLNIAASDANTMSFGIFERTDEDALLKNVIVYIQDSIEINFYNYSQVTYGLLVGKNYGQITNCAVEGEGYSIVYVNLFGLGSANIVNNEIGGLVGENYGQITNSRVEAGISVNGQVSQSASYMPANLGGIAAINNGGATIASSYVKARIENNTAGSLIAKTGGIVSINELGAKITMTYIEGEYLTSNSRIADNTDTDTHIVYTTASAGAFVYENYGEINNSYANIPMVTTNAASGFVFTNKLGGNIEYCFSTSLLISAAKNGSFVGIQTGVTEGVILNEGTLLQCYGLGEIENRYYFKETVTYQGVTYKAGELVPADKAATLLVGYNDKIQQITSTGYGYNYGLGNNGGTNGLGLKIISSYAFVKDSGNFDEFAFTLTATKADGVWFWASGAAEASFERNGIKMSFNSKIPQLVSANTIAAGSQTFNYSEFDDVTGETKYIYNEDPEYREGSQFNPYVVANQDDLEFLTSRQSGFTTGYLIGNYYLRLVGDIIYETSTKSSGLYKYSLLGNLEGNGFTIGNYVIDSSEQLQNAGFFATIGTQSNQMGSVKNLTFAPRYISLTNCNAVGAVAGQVYGTTLVNILVDGFMYSTDYDGLVILGKNSVGGVVGIAEGRFNFNSIKSNISVNSTYRAELNAHPVRNYQNHQLSQVSYSGLIAGVVNGYGKLIYISVYGDNVSIAENAGLMFGFVGKNVSAQRLTATGSSKQSIKADFYGGVIAAELRGTLDIIAINGLGSAQSFFAMENFIPTALGNIVGYMYSGKISNAIVNANLKAQTAVSYLGGAVGTMSAGTLENVRVNGNLTGGSIIGGLVGRVTVAYPAKINVLDSCYSGNIVSNSSSSIVLVGTIIGWITDSTSTIGSSMNNGTINIITSDDFISKMNAETGYTLSSVSITTYSSASNVELWVSTIIQASNTEGNRAKLVDLNGEDDPEEYDPFIDPIGDGDFLKIYGIRALTDSVPLANSYKENGRYKI